jgi:hypothetical protein
MDDPADDSQRASARRDQEPSDNRMIVRRIEITVERDITTVILRRRDEPSAPSLPLEPRDDKDSDDSI